MTISQAAAHLGTAPDTLRYYERTGVVPPSGRDATGRRRYEARDLHLLEVLFHLRETGMPLAHIAEFTRLVASDPDGVPERLAMLQDHRAHVRGQLETWRRSLTVIDQKIRDYSKRLAEE